MRSMNTEEFVYQVVMTGEMEIDDQGRVWRTVIRGGDRWKGGVRLNPCNRRRAEHDQGDYLQVRLMIAGKRAYCLAHRLVWQHFRGPIPDGLTVNHVNGEKKDNRPENLEVVTLSENLRHAFRIGLKQQWGQTNPAAKLTDDQVVIIRETYARGGVSQEKLAQQFGVTFQTISNIVRGERRIRQGGATNNYVTRRRRPNAKRNEKGQFIS